MRQEHAQAQADLQQAHAIELGALRTQYDEDRGAAAARTAVLEAQVRDLEQRCDPATLQAAVDQCRQGNECSADQETRSAVGNAIWMLTLRTVECQTAFAVERDQWAQVRAEMLTEHEALRTDLAQVRGQLHRATAQEAELRAQFAAAVDALETQKAEAEQRTGEAVREVRDEERALFQAQLDRVERDRGALVDEFSSRIAQLEADAQQVTCPEDPKNRASRRDRRYPGADP